MFERYNAQALRALFFARYEASACDSYDIDTQHLLLGVVREADQTAREFFQSFSIAPQRFRTLWPATADRVSSSAELPLTQDAKKALAYTAHVADEFAASEIVPLHLLLGILRVPEGIAGKTLAGLGITWDVAAEVSRHILDKLAAERAREEPITLALQPSHYVVLDKIREIIAAGQNQRSSREEVLLAVIDGLAANPSFLPRVGSLDELRVRIAEAIASLPPGDS